MSTQIKKRGRPAGAVDQVLQDKAFGLDQFAAVKSFLYGIDPLVATKQYMLSDDSPLNTEAAVKRLGQIMLRIAARGNSRGMGPQDAAAVANSTAAAAIKRVAEECLKAVKEIAKKRADDRNAQQAKVAARAKEQGLVALPKKKLPQPPEHFLTLRTFDDWYEDTYRPEDLLDPIELRSQYEEHLSAWYVKQGFYYEPDYSKMHGSLTEQVTMRATQMEGAQPVRYVDEEIRKSAARHIESLQWTVQRIPDASDHVSVWIGGTTLEALKKADIFTLFTLCELIRRRGAAWWRVVPALGPVRAKRLQDWISEVGVHGIHLPQDIFEPIQRRRLMEVLRNERERPTLPALAELFLDPLSPYVDNEKLNGREGIFKNKAPNLLKAETDIDAIVVTLGKYADKRPTLKVYAREITRFCLWIYKEVGLPISSIGVHEARLYREFLDRIPGEWISDSPSPPPRNTAEWRPFRGQLDQASKRKALTSVNVVLGQLMNAGYLTGNPMSGVLKHAELAKPEMDVDRSLSLEQWNFACRVLDEEMTAASSEPASSSKFGGDRLPSLRRLKALLNLLFATGMRRDELFKARLGHLKRVLVDGQACHLLRVTGKRSKVREVLIEPDVMRLVLEHLADRPEGFKDDFETQNGRDLIPLISVIRNPVHAHRKDAANTKPDSTDKAESGIYVGEREMASSDGALSADGLLTQMKAFFARCAPLAHEAGIDREAFDRGTLHWMRHTFGHSMVDAQVDIRVVQRALGHVNINTTMHYSKAGMEQMVRGIRHGASSIKQQAASAASIETVLPTSLPVVEADTYCNASPKVDSKLIAEVNKPET